MEDEESLEAVGLVSQPSYAVHCHLAAQIHCKVCGFLFANAAVIL